MASNTINKECVIESHHVTWYYVIMPHQKASEAKHNNPLAILLNSMDN